MTITNITKNDTIKSIFDLPCFDSRKSFYGKAKIIEVNNGYYLLSYDTIVFYADNSNAEQRQFAKLWDGYSATTQLFKYSVIWEKANQSVIAL